MKIGHGRVKVIVTGGERWRGLVAHGWPQCSAGWTPGGCPFKSERGRWVGVPAGEDVNARHGAVTDPDRAFAGLPFPLRDDIGCAGRWWLRRLVSASKSSPTRHPDSDQGLQARVRHTSRSAATQQNEWRRDPLLDPHRHPGMWGGEKKNDTE